MGDLSPPSVNSPSQSWCRQTFSPADRDSHRSVNKKISDTTGFREQNGEEKNTYPYLDIKYENIKKKKLYQATEKRSWVEGCVCVCVCVCLCVCV